MISLPMRALRRLEPDMAEESATSARFDRRPGQPWTSQRVAEELVPFRDQLITRLSREIAAARDLSNDQRELVIDDAIDHMVTEYAKPLASHEELDRAFWATASFRVKRMHEGRGATVRAGWQRVDLDGLDLEGGVSDPETALLKREEKFTLLEFAAMLTPQEREVFAVKYGSAPRRQGRTAISRWLGLPIADVRKAEREITLKLDRFVTLVAAGALCSYRRDAIASLAEDQPTDQQTVAARIHLKHCSACRQLYAAHARAVRSGELPRRIAGLLPLPVAAGSVAEDRPLRSVLLDWASRPFSGDQVTTATQLAGSGAGRGLGTLAALKLAALCAGSAALTGGVCISLGTFDRDRQSETHVERRMEPRDRAPTDQTLKTLLPSSTAVARRSTGRAKSAQQPRSRDLQQHEASPVSPAPSTSQANGASEFNPTGGGASAPPSAPPATGMSEFP